ncbi:hypothetical protein NDU88_001933 [Pleurodeles waltl]|uniref:Uncharacterized protein n=1 Tax=Pleurodeles waltl TaxID=8319 RepID=A0AAV7MQ58_PLEWA|nr:hypothetical protein NDU88_001933 [Pleurodeles waltl]
MPAGRATDTSAARKGRLAGLHAGLNARTGASRLDREEVGGAGRGGACPRPGGLGSRAAMPWVSRAQSVISSFQYLTREACCLSGRCPVGDLRCVIQAQPTQRGRFIYQ